MFYNPFKEEHFYKPVVKNRVLSYNECAPNEGFSKVYRANVTRTTTWISGQVLTASALNGEFNNLLNSLTLVNADISSSAAIAATKISGTAATLAGPNTFVGPNILTANPYAPSAGGTATLNLSNGNYHTITMPAGNITIAISNGTTSQPFIVRILQDSGGSRTVTWFTTIKWAGGSPPTLTTTASKADEFGFIVTGANTYDGFVVGQNI